MTTICWDGKVLATDSKASQRDIAMIGDHKKLYLPTADQYWEIQGTKVLAFALAGDPDVLPWVLEALEKGVTHRTGLEDIQETDFVTLCITEKGEAWYFGLSRNARQGRNTVILSPIFGPGSAGTGQVIANAVMSIGRSARDAIKQAIRLDNHSGGAIQSWDFPGVPEVLSTRPVVVEEKPATQIDTSKMTPPEMLHESRRLAQEALELIQREAAGNAQ